MLLDEMHSPQVFIIFLLWLRSCNRASSPHRLSRRVSILSIYQSICYLSVLILPAYVYMADISGEQDSPVALRGELWRGVAPESGLST